MTGETVAKALGGCKAGQGWTARCPAHDDRKPSFSIRDADGKVLVRCHAGRSTIPASDTSVEACLAARGLTLQAGVLKSTKIGCRRLVSVASIENLDKVAVSAMLNAGIAPVIGMRSASDLPGRAGHGADAAARGLRPKGVGP